MVTNNLHSTATLGQIIRQRRIELGLTQEELAERVGGGVRQSEISRLERDYVALPRRGRLEALAGALDLTLGQLLMRSGWIESAAYVNERSRSAPDPSIVPLQTYMSTALHEQRWQWAHPENRDEDTNTRQLHDALARAKEVSRHTGEILRVTGESIVKARRVRRVGSR